MKKYQIEVREYLSKIIEVEAESINEAISKTKINYQKAEIVLDYNDYVTTEITEFPENEKLTFDKLSNGDNFYLIEDNYILFWGLDLVTKRIILNEKSLKFIDENELSFNEVCEFSEESDFRLYELFY